MTTVATVNWQNYLGRGVEYANVLFDMVRRNLKEGMAGSFVVFTDDVSETGYAEGIEIRQLKPGTEGWYNKLQLFAGDAFPVGERIIFLDLDTVITGSLDDIAAYMGPFAILRDVYRPDGLQSSVMLWEAGKHGYVWEGYAAFGYPRLPHGDQGWIESSIDNPDILQSLFPAKFVSYKRDARFGTPIGASICFFHGEPRPHECEGWVPHVWKVGGATSAQLELVGNTDADAIRANIRRAEANYGRWLKPVEPHSGIAVICAGGPSLRDEIASISAHAKNDATVFACNAVPNVLSAFSIKTNYHVMLDARPENAQFIWAAGSATCLYASQCDRSVHEAAGDRLTIWHPAFPGIVDIVGEDKERTYIGGGTTCGMKAATLAWSLGYRTIHLYGFDSCYRDHAHHAYPQSLNDGEQILDVEFNGKTYRCSPWMIQQAEDFETFAPQLMDHGVELHVHGSGLIPDIAKQFSKGIFRPEAADFRALAILARLEGVSDPKVAEIGVFAGDLSRRLLARRKDLHLTMVDSWTEAPDAEYAKSGDFHASLRKEEQDQFYSLTQRVTAFAGERARIIRADSRIAASEIPDASLDLVFIDADHSYEGCKADIAAYWCKVKLGGIISGHDYANDDFRFGPMVKRAVDEFAAENGLTIEIGENYTWFCTKSSLQVRAA